MLKYLDFLALPIALFISVVYIRVLMNIANHIGNVLREFICKMFKKLTLKQKSKD